MKKIVYLSFLLSFLSFANAQVFWTEDFETDGEGVATRYTSSNVFNDGSNDHYGRTNGTLPSSTSGSYLSPNNSYFMAGEDLDDNGGDGNRLKTTTFAPQNIAGMTDVRFSGLFAQGSSGGLDGTDSLIVEYNIDGAGWVRFMQFIGISSGSNVGWGEDLDFNGLGNDGTALSTTFASFSKDIAVSGTLMQVRVSAWANSASEEFAYDFLQLNDISGAAPTPTITATPTALTGFTYEVGAVASPSQVVAISALNLIDTAFTTALVNYEISTDGITWFSVADTLQPILGTIPPTPVQVRLKLGLAAGNYNETITLSSTGAVDVTVTLTGEVTAPVVPCSQLFISEYGEPSSGFGKYIELYNPTASSIDLSNYEIWIVYNGGTWPENQMSLSGTLASGEVWIIGSTASPVTGSNQTNGTVTGFNGDDAVGLAYNGGSGVVFSLIDAVGTDGADPGSGWDVAGSSNGTTNGTLVRKASVQSPNDNWASSAGTTVANSEWIVLAYSEDSLDAHASDCIVPCAVSAIALGTQTACVPVSNTYTQEIIVTYSNYTGSGTLEVNGQSFAVTASPQTVTLTGLTADGASVDVTASFSDNPTCTLTETALFSAPANCSLTCNITSITAGAQTACAPLTNTYTQEVTVTYAVAPGSGTLDINGQSFPITGSPQTETLIGLTSDGLAVNVTAVFSADAGCNFTENSLFNATLDCTPAVPCSQLFISEYGEPSSGNGKYVEIYNPTSGNIDLSDYRLVKHTNGGSGSTSTLNLSGSLVSGGVWVVGISIGDIPSADQISGGVIGFNGDDVIELLFDDGSGFAIIDAIGEDTGIDPGTGWDVAGSSNATANQTLVRKASIQSPNDDWASSAGTTVANSEWMVLTYSQDSLDMHTSDCIVPTYTWTGNVDSDWNTAGNWSTNSVPSGTEEIIIPTTPVGGNYPLVSMDVTLEDLTIEVGSQLDMAPTFGLIISGTVVNNGDITLQSSMAGTAWLDDFTNPGATYTGDITVQTYVSTGVGLGQRYFGSSVVSAPVQGLSSSYTGYPLGQIIPLAACDPNQLDASSPYSNLFQWDENNTFSLACVQEGWTAISAAANLIPGRAYSGWMNDGSIISVSGTPNTGDVVYTTTGISGSGVANADGWHLLSNPFPSPLDVASVLSSGFTSPQTYDGGSGAYSGTFNPILITGNNLAVMQGFVAESDPGVVFTAKQTDRKTGNENWLKPEFTHLLEISVAGNSFADRTYLYYDFAATNQFDAFGDTKKRDSNFGQPTLFTELDGEQMSLNGYAIDAMNNVVGMGLKPGANGNFTINVDGIASFPATSLIFLEDKLTGDWINLRETTTYSFDALTSDMVSRFNIHFTAPIEVVTIASSCVAADAEINVDFGTNTMNGNAVSWDYTLIANNNTVATATNVNANEVITNLEKGNYTLILAYNNYEVELDLVVDGADRILADFELPTEVTEGTEVSLINLSTGANNFTWSIADNPLSSDNSPLYTFNTPGLYEVELLASNEDCEETKVKEILVIEKAITAIRSNTDIADANVYVNGSSIYIDLTKLTSNTTTQIEVFNLLGQGFYSESSSNKLIKVNTNTATSYYFVVLSNKDKRSTFKVFVK